MRWQQSDKSSISGWHLTPCGSAPRRCCDHERDHASASAALAGRARAWAQAAGSHLKPGASATPQGRREMNRKQGLRLGLVREGASLASPIQACGEESPSLCGPQTRLRLCSENRGEPTLPHRGDCGASCVTQSHSAATRPPLLVCGTPKCSELEFSIHHSSCRQTRRSRASETSVVTTPLLPALRWPGRQARGPEVLCLGSARLERWRCERPRRVSSSRAPCIPLQVHRRNTCTHFTVTQRRKAWSKNGARWPSPATAVISCSLGGVLS